MSSFSAPSRERLATPVRELMRPGVIVVPEHATLLEAKRAMVRHGVHAVLVVGETDGRPLGWVSDSGLLPWLERDLSAIHASHGITEPAHYVDPDATAHEALEALAAPGVTHLLVGPSAGGAPHGVLAPIDLVDLVTQP
jgi:predicted transcriptional regulator